jgi:hypothetical protein
MTQSCYCVGEIDQKSKQLGGTIDDDIVTNVTISSLESFCVAFSVMGQFFHDETHHS